MWQTKGDEELGQGPGWSLVLIFVLPLVAGLDVRFSLTRELSTAWNILGAFMLAIGLGLDAWALIPGVMAAALMIIRTSLEDRTLQAELPGYQDFVQEIRYRLVPRIW